MPLSVPVLQSLEREAKSYERPVSFCTLGRLWPVEDVTYGDVIDVAARSGRPVDLPPGVDRGDPIPSEDFAFEALGFDVTVVDIQHEGPHRETYYFDLNLPSTPGDLLARFDLVFNPGTVEHVFHLPNALAHVTKMLRVGGRVVHHYPVNNTVGHGFYQISPCLLFDYCAANRLVIERSQIAGWMPDHMSGPLPEFPDGFFDPYADDAERWTDHLHEASILGILVARKTADSTADQIPLQGGGGGPGKGYAPYADQIDPNRLHRRLGDEDSDRIRFAAELAELVEEMKTMRETYEYRLERLQENYSQVLKQLLDSNE